jgi:hypothetical protein
MPLVVNGIKFLYKRYTFFFGIQNKFPGAPRPPPDAMFIVDVGYYMYLEIRDALRINIFLS